MGSRSGLAAESRPGLWGRSLARPAWVRPARLAAGLGRWQVRLHRKEGVSRAGAAGAPAERSAVRLPPPLACSLPASVQCRPNSDRLERTRSSRAGGRGRCPEALAYSGRPAFVSESRRS